MNERIKELAEQADIVFGFDKNNDPEVICAVIDIEKFAELIVQECADYIREIYDHQDAESLAWSMEIKFGLHGDYA